MNRQVIAIIHSVGGLVFDATFEETHESTLAITDNPCEVGVIVSDGAFMEPQRVTISAGVSDVAISTQLNDAFASTSSRSQTAFSMLQKLQAAADPFDVQTGLKLYKNMLIAKIHTSQDKDTDKVFIFQADLREVIIVTTQLVTYTPRAPGRTAHQGAAKTSKGEQQGAQVVDAPKKASIAMYLGKMTGMFQ